MDKYLLCILIAISACQSSEGLNPPLVLQDELSDDTIVSVITPVTVEIGKQSQPDIGQAPDYKNFLPIDLPDDTRLQEVGFIQANSRGLLPEISLDIPEGVYSVTMLVYGHPQTTLVLDKLYAPNGATWADPDDANWFFDDAVRVIPSDSNAAILIPNTPDVDFIPGHYRVRLTASIQQTKHEMRPLYVTLLVRYAIASRAHGILDLVLHFTGAQGITAATAPDHPALQQALQTMKDIYGQANITIGQIEYVDVNDPTLQTILLTGAECGLSEDFNDLIRHSSDGQKTGLHLLFIDRFECLGDNNTAKTLVGMSSGSPGIPLVSGIENSGVVVSLAYLNKSYQETAQMMAHESGHFLGLFHTKESKATTHILDLPMGELYDTITDTPNDPASARNNLMFWVLTTSTTLTPGQAYVLRRNPLVHP
jgi:hypothetical protein